MIQNPFYFGAREVGINYQAGGVLDILFQALFLQFRTVVRRARILPDDSVIDRLAGLFIPDNRRFALVGNADCGDLIGANIRMCQHFYQRGALRSPDVHGIVFNPARFRVDLGKFALGNRDNVGVMIENNGAGAGCALIERDNIFFICRHNHFLMCKD